MPDGEIGSANAGLQSAKPMVWIRRVEDQIAHQGQSDAVHRMRLAEKAHGVDVHARVLHATAIRRSGVRRHSNVHCAVCSAWENHMHLSTPYGICRAVMPA